MNKKTKQLVKDTKKLLKQKPRNRVEAVLHSLLAFLLKKVEAK